MDEVAAETWVRNVAAGRGEALMEEVLATAQASGSEVLVMDGAMVFGADQVISAATLAAKAIALLRPFLRFRCQLGCRFVLDVVGSACIFWTYTVTATDF